MRNKSFGAAQETSAKQGGLQTASKRFDKKEKDALFGASFLCHG